MALTVPQLEAHFGRWLRTLVAQADTPARQEKLLQLAVLLEPYGRWYVLNGTLGTQADRQEAMERARKGMYQQITGVDPDGHAGHLHTVLGHWALSEDPTP